VTLSEDKYGITTYESRTTGGARARITHLNNLRNPRTFDEELYHDFYKPQAGSEEEEDLRLGNHGSARFIIGWHDVPIRASESNDDGARLTMQRSIWQNCATSVLADLKQGVWFITLDPAPGGRDRNAASIWRVVWSIADGRNVLSLEAAREIRITQETRRLLGPTIKIATDALFYEFGITAGVVLCDEAQYSALAPHYQQGELVPFLFNGKPPMNSVNNMGVFEPEFLMGDGRLCWEVAYDKSALAYEVFQGLADNGQLKGFDLAKFAAAHGDKNKAFDVDAEFHQRTMRLSVLKSERKGKRNLSLWKMDPKKTLPNSPDWADVCAMAGYYSVSRGLLEIGQIGQRPGAEVAQPYFQISEERELWEAV
jgi:hypothetical protein